MTLAALMKVSWMAISTPIVSIGFFCTHSPIFVQQCYVMTFGCISRFLATSGTHMAYTLTSGSRRGLLVFISGLNSTFTDSKKATFLSQLAQRHNWDYMTFDHLAHGATGGQWSDVTMTRWVNDATELLNFRQHDAAQSVVLVGTSMGLWITVLLAERMPNVVKGIVGIGGSVNFHHRWLKEAAEKGYEADVKWTKEQGRQRSPDGEALWRPIQMPDGLRRDFLRPSRYSSEPYEIPFPFLASLFQVECSLPLTLSCPLSLVHGLADADVPWREAVQLLHADTPDSCLMLIGGEGHRLSGESGLSVIEEAVVRVVTHAHQEPAETNSPRY